MFVGKRLDTPSSMPHTEDVFVEACRAACPEIIRVVEGVAGEIRFVVRPGPRPVAAVVKALRETVADLRILEVPRPPSVKVIPELAYTPDVANELEDERVQRAVLEGVWGVWADGETMWIWSPDDPAAMLGADVTRVASYTDVPLRADVRCVWNPWAYMQSSDEDLTMTWRENLCDILADFMVPDGSIEEAMQ